MINVEQYMNIKTLKTQGHSIRAIARITGHSRNTVRKVLREEHTMKVKQSKRKSKLDPYKCYLKNRYEECELSGERLIKEIEPMGYEGSVQTVRRYIKSLKQDKAYMER